MNQKYDIDKSEAKTQAHKRLFFLKFSASYGSRVTVGVF